MTTNKLKTSYFYKLFRVKRADGRITTVSVNPILFTMACKTLPGGPKEVSRLARDAAFTYEDGMFKNCSGYVSKQLQEAISRVQAARKLATTPLAA
jgi:hypothetical protein